MDFSTITLADDTPANHDFEALSVASQECIAVNRDDLNTTPAGNAKIRFYATESRPDRPTERVTIQFSLPKEKTVDGVVVIDNVARANIDVVIPDNWTIGERADFRTFSIVGRSCGLYQLY